MLRLIILLLSITALSLGFAWIADEPGHVSVDWGDYHLESSLLVLLASIAFLALACMLTYTLLFTLIRTPRMWLRSQLARRQSLGLTALTDAFAAIATQDMRTAKKQIARAQQYIPHQPLTLMLSAQIATLEGDEPKARLYLEQMLKAESTEFMAMRSLTEKALRNHDYSEALICAEKALALKPQDEWLITTLAGLYTREGRTQQALQLLEQSARKRHLHSKEAREMGAYVQYENALTLISQKRLDFAITVLENALSKMPGFVPAAAKLAQTYTKQGDVKRAIKVIENAWKIAPHPLLSQALLECYDANVERRRVVYAAEKLASIHSEQRESQYLLASLAMKRHDYTSAANYLRHLAHEKETVRICTMMADLETNNENSEQAAYWLKRVSAAIPDPGWVCEDCHQPTNDWHLACPQCGSVASIVWK